MLDNIEMEIYVSEVKTTQWEVTGIMFLELMSHNEMQQSFPETLIQFSEQIVITLSSCRRIDMPDSREEFLPSS